MKPNVLWIYGEDLYPDLACYGTQTVQTPVLDHFASEGVFQRLCDLPCLLSQPFSHDYGALPNQFWCT